MYFPGPEIMEMEREGMAFESYVERLVQTLEQNQLVQALKQEQLAQALGQEQQQRCQEVPSCEVLDMPMTVGQSTVEVLDDPAALDQQPKSQPAQVQRSGGSSDVSMDVSDLPSTSTAPAAASAGSSRSVPVAHGQGPGVLSPASPATPASPTAGTSATQGGLSPKRKADDSQTSAGVMETDSSSGQPIAKEAKLTEPAEERREDVEQLVHVLSRFRRRPISPTRIQRYRLMPRHMVQELMDELHYRDMHFSRRFSRRPGDSLDRRREELSDEDSDSDQPRPIRSDPTIGGAKFVLDDRQQLLRLLILGSPTQAKASNVDNDPLKNQDFQSGVLPRMLNNGEGCQIVETVRDVSVKGRSARQDGLVYALARCCRCADIPTKRAAYSAIKDVCRTPTQLFQLINYIETIDEKTTGWGRGLRRAVCDWYNSNSNNPVRLAMQVTKYWNRHGWCHKDLFRLSHIKPVDEAVGFIVRYSVKGMQEAEKFYLEDGSLGNENLQKVHKYLKAVEEAKQCMELPRVLELIQEFDLVREQLRTEMLNQPEVWTQMLRGMPLTAMLRNLNKMTSLNLFEDPDRVLVVKEKLGNMEAMRKARVHPFRLLLAHHIYKQGHGDKGSLTWTPNQKILDAMEAAFYESFGLVQPTNKRILIALDISGSMTSKFMNSPVECREAATLMAMVTVKVEPNCDIVGFHNKLVPLDMFKNPAKKLDDLVYETHHLGFGTTDCSKPMTWARHKNKEYDAFIIYTDSETNSHRTPPWLALKKYRDKMNLPNAKLIVVGIAGYGFTIAQPGDINMLDVVGFDTETPGVISDFLTGGWE